MFAAVPPPWRANVTADTPLHYFQNTQRSVRVFIKSKIEPPPPLPEKQQKGLSGSDVLIALQRAAKAKKLVQKHNKKRVNNVPAAATPDNSKPLCIKPEWNDRLQQLEMRLRELSHA